jgi:DNA-directed RNA polymerase subunit alpha
MKLREITLLCNHKLSPRLEYSLFRIAPFLKGQSLTVASTLRRILLNELNAVKITSVTINEPTVISEFSLLPGFKEPLPDVLNNLRETVFRLSLNENHPLLKQGDDTFGAKEKKDSMAVLGEDSNLKVKKTDFPYQALIEWTGKGILTAENIKFIGKNQKLQVNCVDPTQYIATGLSPYAKLSLNLYLNQSKKYVEPIGAPYLTKSVKSVIPLTPSFNPVKRVNYIIKQNSSFTYEFVLFEIWTDGSITPTEALGHSSVAGKQLFQPFL